MLIIKWRCLNYVTLYFFISFSRTLRVPIPFYLTIIGCLVYLPFRRHWDKVFGWVDAIIFDCCLAIPLVLYACFFVYTETPPTTGNIIATVIAAIVGAVVGLVILVDCWRRCSNIIEIIFLPLVMIMVFCMIILFWWIFLLLMGFATKSDDR